MNRTLVAIASAIGLSLSGAALAQDLDFATLDTDMNGSISFEELQVALPDVTEDQFASYDTDGNGELSEEELAAVSSAGADAEAPAAQ